MDLIATTAALAEACARLAAHPFVTVDTEFMRETTYYPEALPHPDGGAGRDRACSSIRSRPSLDLAPFFALMADEGVVKVFHSARQDLEIIWLLGGLLPQPFFDTQVAAMVCGYGDSVSYEQLVNDVAKAKIDKSSRFTDWSRRPLSDAQLTYALSDVTHLVKVYEVLARPAPRDRPRRVARRGDERAHLARDLPGRSGPGLAPAVGPDAQAPRDRGADGGRRLARARGADAATCRAGASSRTRR